MLGYNYGKVLNIPGFWVCQVCVYASVVQVSEYAWIWLNDALWQGSEYVWSTFHRAQNMARLWISKGYKGCWICLNKPEYALIMSQYEWICLKSCWIWLNILTYTWKKKQSAEYDIIILSVSDAVYSIRSLNSLSNYQDRHIHCQTFKIMHFAKRIMPECRCTTRNFSGQEEGFVERRHFDKHFIKNTIRAFPSKIRKLLSP